MRRCLPVVGVLITLLWVPSIAQDARGALDAAIAAMGASNLHAVEYTAVKGNQYALGQAPGPGKPWPRFTVTQYSMRINYDALVMREQTTRIDDEKPPRGGGAGGYNPESQQGGIRPIPFGPNVITTLRNGQTPDGALQIWLTPHGFLKGAAANAATLTATPRDRNGSLSLSFKAFEKYTVTGTLTRDNLVERVRTTVAHPLYGDSVIETQFSGYQDVGGVKFPSRMIQRQGGFPLLDVALTAQPGAAAAAALTVPAPGARGRGQGEGPAPAPAQGTARLTTRELAPGFWAIAGIQSFIIDFRDFVVVVEAPASPARMEEVLAEARLLAPGKPIRYVVNSHQHADHSGGLRAAVAAGLTILTHEVNVPFYNTMLRNPATIEPDALARNPRAPILEGVADKKVITDGTRVVEVHHVRGNLHSEGLLMVYLTKERMLIQADLFSPRQAEAKPLPWSTITANFYDNIRRLKLDVAQMVHVHGGTDPFDKLVAAANLPHE
ncbi:MAG: MBL fold metallo-hydrolase [Acidobacteria bacterium]|nr:MBL fold metallo-hydrolase [Acidobacteriota bacterium]